MTTDPLDRHDLVRAIHDSPLLLVAHVTGGGSEAIAALLGMPGASRTVLEITVPYAASALRELVGNESAACSAATAAALAHRAHDRALGLAPTADPAHVAGVGVTAALATDRVRRGADRAHLAVVGADGLATRLVDLDGVDGRGDQERAVSDALLRLVHEAAVAAARDGGPR